MAERAQHFLQQFWDLASPQRSTRQNAACGIVKHVLQQQSRVPGNASNEEPALAEDTTYALKRLVRGITSSRDAARQGFSACLTELLLALPGIGTERVMQMIEEATQETAGTKGQEERDLMLGRVFGSLVLLQAKRLEDLESMEKVFQWLHKLADKKNWLQEICFDGLLQLIQHSKDSDARLLAAKLQPLLEGRGVQEFNPEQLMLALGLKRLAANKKGLRKVVDAFLPSGELLSSSSIEPLADMFKRSSAGFPKIHRMWDYILAEIFLAFGQPIAEIGAGRAAELTQEQLDLLDALAAFVDNDFANASHEKKGLAMRLVVMMLRMAPSSAISLVVRKNLLRSIMNAAGNKTNVLHDLSLQVLQDMVAAVSDDPRCGLELASVFMKEGDLNFDRRTGTSTVVSLVQGMDKQTLLEQVDVLEQVLASAPTAVASKKESASKQDEDGEDTGSGDEGKEDDTSAALQRHLTAMDTLINIVRNPAVKHKWELVNRVATLLLTLAYVDAESCQAALQAGSGAAQKKSKTPKKGKKEKGGTAAAFSLSETVSHAAGFLAGMHSLPTELRAAAVKRLHTLLADLGHLSRTQIESDKQGQKGQAQQDQHQEQAAGGETVHSVLLERLREMLSAGVKFSTAGNSEQDDDEELLQLVQSVASSVDELQKSDDQRLASAFTGLLIQALFHALSTSLFPSEDESIDTAGAVDALCEHVSPLLAIVAAGGQQAKSDDEDDDDDDEDVCGTVAGLTLDLLAGDSDLSTRGIRDAARKFWTALANKKAVSEDAVQTFMLTVAGGSDEPVDEEDGEEGEEEDGDDAVEMAAEGSSDDEEEEDEDNDDEEDEDEDENEDDKAKGKGNRKQQQKKKQEKKAAASEEDDDEEEEEEEEDILLDDADLMRVLEEDDDLDPSVLVHSEEADGALGKMLKLKQMSRKAGLLQAKRQEFRLRLRALDLLEAVVQKEERRSILLSMFEPLCKALQKLAKSNVAKTVPEGSALQEKLRSFIINKLCRRNPPKQTAGDELDAETFKELLVDLLAFRAKATTPLIAEAALNCIGASCRLALSMTPEQDNAAEVKEGLTEIVREYLAAYMQKRNRKVQSDVFDDLINRFPAFWVENLLGDLLESSVSAPNMYLKSESFRYLNLLYSKRKGLPQPDQQLLADAVPRAVDSLVALSAVKDEDKAKQANKAKRLKPILQFAVVLAQIAVAGDEQSGDMSEAREKLQEFAQTIAEDNQSPVLRQICNRIEAVISKAQSGNDGEDGQQKQTKKQKQGQQQQQQQQAPAKKQKADAKAAAQQKDSKKDRQQQQQQQQQQQKKKRPAPEQEEEETKTEAVAAPAATSSKKKREKAAEESAGKKVKRPAAALQSEEQPAAEESKKKKKPKKST